MKNFKLSFLLIFLCVFLVSQKPANKAAGDYVPGEMIIMLDVPKGMSQVDALDLLSSEYRSAEMEPLDQLSKRMKIWTIKFNPSRTTDKAILSSVKSNPLILEAQFNHYVELRESIPSDQYFDNQWNMHNTGQSGGLADADIDGPEAWDFARGGTTVLGDTIIVAIVDDGFDIDHDDIVFWKNWQEIPGNSIDDDGNGYVDDYDGWNSWNQSGNLIMRDHGTHVSGIAAARGNNDMGVCGVNWYTKVMPIVGSATVESIVVDAYSYVYEMRRRYNETNGDSGAFVVATNSSFGVNQGQPEDFPIWEAMYDSLGMVGVLSAGATANANWNIDEVGDIPTAMESEYLITVTNTTNTDEKNSGAGYGLTTIDLGAPGTQIYSTRQNNAYGYKTGTSMATPHVAGAIALLYSAFDSSFMESYKADPANTCLIVKQNLLDAVDQVDDLDGKTVTGGRLNVYNAINSMAFYLSPNSIHIEGFADNTFESAFYIHNNLTTGLGFENTVENPDEWLSVSPDTGTVVPLGSKEIAVYVNTAGLAAGTYTNKVNVDANGQNSSLTVYLNLLAPIISNPDNITEKIEAGDSGEFGMTLTNITQNAVSFEATLQTPSTWMSIDPFIGNLQPGGNQAITLSVETMGIAPGIYNNAIEVEYDNLGKVIIPIEIEVFVPALFVSVDSLHALLGPGETDDTSFTLRNNTDVPLPFNISTQNPVLWMSYEPTEGTIIPNATITVDFTFNSLVTEEGIHNNNLIITYNETEETSIPVKLQVIYFGIDEVKSINNVSVKPNPVRQNSIISFQLNDPASLQISLYNIHGQLLEVIEKGEYMTGTHQIKWNPNGIKGVYFVRITDGIGTVSRKVVVL